MAITRDHTPHSPHIYDVRLVIYVLLLSHNKKFLFSSFKKTFHFLYTKLHRVAAYIFETVTVNYIPGWPVRAPGAY